MKQTSLRERLKKRIFIFFFKTWFIYLKQRFIYQKTERLKRRVSFRLFIFFNFLFFLNLTIPFHASSRDILVDGTIPPVANAGPNDTIYFTQTTTATLDGSGSSGDSYQWSKIYDVQPLGATYPVDNATITSPTSPVTTVTGLVQGTWYYQLAVTRGGITKYDTTVVEVNYSPPPAGSQLVFTLPLNQPGFVSNVNNRFDTTDYIGYTFPNGYLDTLYGIQMWIERGRLNDAMVDSSRGKLYTTIEDGYPWGISGYSRTELQLGTGFPVDTSKTYLIEWRGYYPQNFDSVGGFLTIMQIHGDDGSSPPFAFDGNETSIYFMETNYNGNGAYTTTAIGTNADFVNQTHTIDLIVREGKGYVGQKAFVKVELDGVTKYYRDTGNVGSTLMHDWFKFASLYDWGNHVVNPDISYRSRGKHFSLVTEAYNIYTLNDQTNQPPVANAGNNQTITLPADSVLLDGSSSYDPDGTITKWKWTKQSGLTGDVISDSTASKTTISGLTPGTYIFTLTVTDNQGASSSANVTVIVNKKKDTTVTPPPNQPPVAKAGSNQTITLPLDSVILDGSASYDSDGKIVSWKWTQQSGPAIATFGNNTLSKTNVLGLIAGTYIFTLTVMDNQGASSSANDTIIVNKQQVTIPPPPNQPPVAKAGSNQTITLPLDSVILDGSASYDPDGTIAGWKWTKQSGPTGNVISDSTASKTSVSGLTAGTYIFTLTVTDNQGASSSANDTIIVNKQNDIIVTPPPPNQPPVAKAGSNQTITLPLDSVILDGSSSYDSDGMIVNWKWTKQSGPAGFIISDSNASKIIVLGLTAGTYIFTLTVTDNQGASSSANDTIIVNKQQVTIPPPPPNQPPAAKAGSNQTITLPLDSVILDGSASYDPDGTITGWKWTKQSGPAGFIIGDSTASKTTVSGLTAGTYIFTLTVTDNQGASSSVNDTIRVNRPPVANAGSGTNLFLPDDSALLNGTASYDPDGKIVSWSWSQTSGPSAINILNVDSARAKVNQLTNGVYVFALIVTDNDGAKDTAAVTIGVYQKPNQPPVANAGKDITIVLPQNTVTLDGTASYDPDGTIVKYHWNPMTGPTGATMLTPDSSTCIVSGLQMGTYDFQLTVTDNKGLSSTATVSVYVLPGQDTTTTTFHIYPNPAHDELNVQLDKAVTGLLAFRIIDVNGRILKVYQFGQLPMHVTKVLDISSLAPGMYFVQLIEDNQLGNVAKMIKY